MSVIESKNEMRETTRQNFKNNTVDTANADRKLQDLESCRAHDYSYSKQETCSAACANKQQPAPLSFMDTAFQGHLGKISEERTNQPDNPIHISESERLDSSPKLHTLLLSLEKNIQTLHGNGSMKESLKQCIAIIKCFAVEISELKCKMDDLGTRNHNLESLIEIVVQTHGQNPPMHSRHHRPNEGTAPVNAHDPAQRPDTEQNQVGQVNNPGVKRKHGDSIRRTPVEVTPIIASPKRRTSDDASHTFSGNFMSTKTLPSQPHIVPVPSPGSQLQYPTSVPHEVQQNPSGDGWRPGSKSMIQQRPPRNGSSQGSCAPNNRSGRMGKSPPASTRYSTAPGCNEKLCQALSDVQIPPSGYYNRSLHPEKTASRRGGLRNSFSPSIPANSFELHKGGVGIGSPLLEQDEHVKKRRFKPVRNAAGVLLRKDGQPDMRAKRKKTLRKGGQRKIMGSAFTPINRQPTIWGATNCPIATKRLGSSTISDISSSLQKKHNLVLRRMFPNGTDNSRRESDYAAEVFGETHTQQ